MADLAVADALAPTAAAVATPAASAPSDALIHVQATSGREWRLRPVRFLRPNIQVVHDATRPTAPPLVLKTLVAPTDDALRPLLAELSAWRRAATADSSHILPLLDVAVSHRIVHMLTPLCPSGNLTVPRPEHHALRLLASVASALQIALPAVRQHAHGNITPAHILVDHAGNARLAGWGITRIRRQRPPPPAKPPTERDDVRALAATLYATLYAHRFDASRARRIPDTPVVSPHTRRMLSEILFEGRVPELHVFRYDLAAARGLVPPSPSLPPHPHRRPYTTDVDTGSPQHVATRNTHTTPNASPPRHRVGSPASPVHPQFPLSPHMASPPSPRRGASTPNRSPSPPIARSSTPPAALPLQTAATSVPSVTSSGDGGAHDGTATLIDSSSLDLVWTATSGDLKPVMDEPVDSLIELTAVSEDAPLRIFKVLFRLPISKNPIVAYKSVALLHRFVAEGSAKLTAQAISNDGFLNWIETSWSRERIQNKTGKFHMFTYCFAGGDIAWYTSLIRKRCEVHAKFAETFTTHWMIRPDGSAKLDPNRREAFRSVVDIVEKCSAVVRRAVVTRDPSAPVKRSVVPLLVTELCKTYTTLCWMFCTASEALRRAMRAELEVAHNATRTGMHVVSKDNELAVTCHPAALRELEETVPEVFDEGDLLASLKRLRKKKKKRMNTVTGGGSESTIVASGVDEKGDGTEPNGETVEEGQAEWIAERDLGGPRSSKEERRNSEVNGRAKVRRGKNASDSDNDDVNGEIEHAREVERADDRYRQRRDHRHSDSEELWRDGQDLQREGRDLRREVDIDWKDSHLATSDGRSVGSMGRKPVVSGLKKWSVSVRKGNAQNGMENDFRSRLSLDGLDGFEGREYDGEWRDSSYRRRDDDLVERRDERRRSLEARDSKSDSGPEEDTVTQHEHRSRGSSQRSRSASVSRRTRALSGSDSEEVATSEDGERRKRASSKRSHGAAAMASAERSTSSDAASDEVKRSVVTKRTSVKKRVDEKSIPFDKKPPEKKKAAGASAKKATGGANDAEREEYSGGSREALAAAAQGKKTPNMNPDYEVAPNEVTFGPQIGSGGFGVVYKAKFRTETVAVKKIHGHALSNAASIGEFQAEVAVLCTLRHSNILRFVGACTKPPHLMIITEFMACGTLFDLLHASQTRVTWAMRKKFAMDTCLGMRYLHDSKLLHRDLKSSNLMLDRELNCKVGDFGLTRISKGTAAVQMTGQCGTFQYMAVEVLANKPYSEKADVFSFGILLWEMVARKLPYFGMQPMQVGLAVVQQGLRPTIPPKTPKALSNLMQACWDSDPNRRPSFAQLVETLEGMPD